MPNPSSPADFWAGDLPTIASLGGREEYVTMGDGVALRTAAFRAPADPKKVWGTVVILPGRAEFIEKYLEVIAELISRGLDVRIIDWRGQGGSSRTLSDREKSHIDHYQRYTEDLREVMDTTVRPAARGPVTMLAHSMGALIGLSLLRDHPGRFDRAVLTSPMTSIEVGRPGQWAILSRLLWLGALPLIGTRFLPGAGPYRPRGRGTDNPLTSDATRASIMRRYIASTPGLALGGPTVRWLAASRDAMARIMDKNAPPIDTEILIVSSSEDRVVGVRTQLMLHEECLTNSRIEIIDGARHEILMEQDRYRGRFWDLFDDFVLGAAS
ncbi:MAG: alpha/beta hydrolase [Alphaproteobacteria bacterium]|nr:alpha/beta hydrolase [Alphaproteobacteria bacterium]